MRKILDYLPGIVLPLLMFYFFFLIPLRKVRRARFWRKTPCLILSSAVSEDETDSGMYRIDVIYRYDFAGANYSASRYSFSPSSATSGHRWKRRIANRLARSKPTFCYVNPEDPCDAVIERGVTWDMVGWGIMAIIFFGVFVWFSFSGAWVPD